MIIFGGVIAVYGVEPALPQNFREALPNFTLARELRAQKTAPTSDWSMISIYLHEGGPGSDLITDMSTLETIDLSGAKAEPLNKDEWVDHAAYKFYDPGLIVVGSWSSGVNYRGPDMNTGEIHIYNYNDVPYNYPPAARFGMAKKDSRTVKCDATDFTDEGKSSWPMAQAELTQGPPTTGMWKYMFTDGGDEDDLEYKWEFDDGTTATGPEVTHTFPSTGDHEVTLTVTDIGGKKDTKTKSINLTAPEYKFVVDATSPSGIAMGDVSVDGGSFDTHHEFTFKEGTTHTLKAEDWDDHPSFGDTSFQGWSGDINRLENPTTVTIKDDMHIYADFSQTQPDIDYTLSVNLSPEAGGSVMITRPDGSTETYSSSFSEKFSAEKTVELSPSVASGYNWDSWSGDISTQVMDTGVQMTRNINVTANFTEEGGDEPTYYDLSTSSTEGGHVEPSGGSYKEGKELTMRAVEDSGYNFDHWEGDLSGTVQSQFLTMNSDKSVKAVFKKKTVMHDINTKITPSGAGSIGLNPDRYRYPDGSNVEASVVAYEGYKFVKWDGDVSGDSKNINFTIHDDMTLEAVFKEIEDKEKYTLTTEVAQGRGTVEPDSTTVTEGTNITVIANPSKGYAFDHWGGDASGMENPKVVTVDSDKTVKAYFKEIEKNEHTLTMKVDPGEGGSITAEKIGVAGQVKTSTFIENAKVQVKATASKGFEFEEWKGSVSGTNPTATLLMTADKEVKAVFREVGETVNMYMVLAGIAIALIGVAVIIYLKRRR